MTDPFRVLRAPVTSADPDPGFAARLRARLERALDLPEGVAVSGTGAFRQPHPAPVAAPRRRVRPGEATSEARGRARGAAPAPRQGDIGYASLWIPDIERAAEFYTAVLGWVYEPSHNPLARQVRGRRPRSTLFCSYVVDDAAAAAARVRAAGGQAGDPIQRPFGLVADCTDNQGTKFAVHQYPQAAAPGADTAVAARTGSAAADPSGAPHDGDLAYVTLEVVDSQLARDFYGAVLGWRFAPGRVADGWQVVGTTPMIGLSGGQADATGVPVWRVADLRAAVARVWAAGGTATEPGQEPYGLMADCADDQGTRFNLGEFPSG